MIRSFKGRAAVFYASKWLEKLSDVVKVEKVLFVAEGEWFQKSLECTRKRNYKLETGVFITEYNDIVLSDRIRIYPSENSRLQLHVEVR